MNNVLLTTGLACIIAAIVGGGLSAFNINVPVINSVKRQIILGTFGAIILGLTFFLRDKPSTPKANLKISEIAWGENDTLNISVENSGNKKTLVKEGIIRVDKIWRFVPNRVYKSRLSSSATYNVKLEEKDTPYEIKVPFAQIVDSSNYDMFSIRFSTDNMSPLAYLFSVQLFYEDTSKLSWPVKLIYFANGGKASWFSKAYLKNDNPDSLKAMSSYSRNLFSRDKEIILSNLQIADTIQLTNGLQCQSLQGFLKRLKSEN